MRLFVTRTLIKEICKNTQTNIPEDVFKYDDELYPHFHLLLDMFEFKLFEIAKLEMIFRRLLEIPREDIITTSDHAYLTRYGLIKIKELGLVQYAEWGKIGKQSKKNSNDSSIQEVKQSNDASNSNVRGVKYNKKKKQWKAQIQYHGKIHDLGYFDIFDDAVKARKEAEKQYWSFQ